MAIMKLGNTMLRWIPLVVALKNERDGSRKPFLRVAEVENAEVASRYIHHSENIYRVTVER